MIETIIAGLCCLVVGIVIGGVAVVYYIRGMFRNF